MSWSLSIPFFERDPSSLNKEEKEIFDILTDKSSLGKVRQQLLYLEKDEETINKVKYYVLTGSTLGGFIGLYFSQYTESFIKKATCVLVGTIVGGSIPGVYWSYKISRSTKFIDWKINAINQEFYKKFTDYIDKDNELCGLRCAISGELIVDPMNVKGHKHGPFEKIEIYNWIETNGGKCQCPYDDGDEIEKKDLEEDTQYRYKVCYRIKQLCNEELNEGIKAGLQAFIENCKEENKRLYEKVKEHIDNGLKYSTIGIEDAQSLWEENNKRYNENNKRINGEN